MADDLTVDERTELEFLRLLRDVANEEDLSQYSVDERSHMEMGIFFWHLAERQRRKASTSKEVKLTDAQVRDLIEMGRVEFDGRNRERRLPATTEE